MNRKIAAGAAGGLIAGVALDIVMRLMPARDGGSMIAFGAHTVHASSALAGWLAYLVYGVVIGAVFGWLLHTQRLDDLSSMVWGGLYGVGWGIVASLVLIPALRGAWPFSIAAVDQGREIALPLLIGHVVYGVILGLAWSRITNGTSLGQRPDTARIAPRRAA